MVDVNNSLFGDYVNFLKYAGGSATHPFDRATITVNIEGLKDNAAQYACAVKAMDMWTAFTGLKFTLVSGAASTDIVIDNELAGAYWSPASLEMNARDFINIAKTWDDNLGYEPWSTGGYGLQTFIHEIGHALGLNHGGDYDGSGTYEADAKFAIDTWQYSVMSYFEQKDHKENQAVSAYLFGPMIADIKAISDLYGRLDVNTGDTVYGRGETFLGGLTDIAAHEKSTFVINDTGGRDLWDCGNLTIGSVIDLRSGYFSDIGGRKGNVSIALGTVIERAIGTAGSDTIQGNDADNELQGGAGDDTINGGAGNDSLTGGAGTDLLDGGLGSDTYVLEDGMDKINDAGGTDTILSLISRSLVNYASIENLTLTGNAAANATGNNLNNFIFGNGANNTLNGGAGNDALYGRGGRDILSGGAGKDSFYFDASLEGGANIDKILDFNVRDDTIFVDDAIFTALKLGQLSSSAFTKNTSGKATKSSHRIIYETDTGFLFYDSNGSKSGGSVKFAELSKKLAVTHADFILV